MRGATEMLVAAAVGIVALGGATAAADDPILPRGPIQPYNPVRVTKDVATSYIQQTSGRPLLRTSLEILVKNISDKMFGTSQNPGIVTMNVTCKRTSDNSVSPKQASASASFLLEPGYSVGWLGSGKFMKDIDSQGMQAGECIRCTVKRQVTHGANVFYTNSTVAPLYCPIPSAQK